MVSSCSLSRGKEMTYYQSNCATIHRQPEALILKDKSYFEEKLFRREGNRFGEQNLKTQSRTETGDIRGRF